MGISSALNAGVMGLGVNSSKLATISDNIANSETKGYKRATIEFNSLVLSERPTSYDAGGVRASTVRAIEDQGAITSTRNVLDLAISGRGFLPVADIASVRRGDPLQLMMTRTGGFRPDYQGFLTTTSGLTLHGWAADSDGSFGTNVQDGVAGLTPVRLNPQELANQRTSEINLRANLDASAPVDSTFFQGLEYFNTVGNSRYLDLYFEKTAANTWSMLMFDRPEAGYASGGRPDPALAAGEQPFAAYTVVFDTTAGGNSGGILSVTEVPAATVLTLDGTAYTVPAGTPAHDPLTGVILAQPPTNEGTISLNIGADNSMGGLIQIASENQLLDVVKNGTPASKLVSIEIDETGLMDAIFDSGFRKTLFKIPIAYVQNPNGMRTLDGQAFSATRASGGVALYEAGDGPTGGLISSALEESTTDVAEELTQLIKTQRAYSSNAKIIQTVDEMLQETTNLKR